MFRRPARRDPTGPWGYGRVAILPGPILAIVLVYEDPENHQSDANSLRRKPGLPSHYRVRLEKSSSGQPWLEIGLWSYIAGLARPDAERQVTLKVDAGGSSRPRVLSWLRSACAVEVMSVLLTPQFDTAAFLESHEAGSNLAHPNVHPITILDGLTIFGRYRATGNFVPGC